MVAAMAGTRVACKLGPTLSNGAHKASYEKLSRRTAVLASV